MRWLKNNLGYLLIVVGIFGFILYNYLSQPLNVKQVSDSATITDVISDDLKFKAEIKGEVNSPGIYAFNEGDRVVDLINLAGGTTDSAYLVEINQSERLVDEMVVVIPMQENKTNPEPIIRYLQVEIKGEVNFPGVYKMKENSIINDLIIEAGGLTIEADTSQINLAEKLSDESLYIIEKNQSNTIYVEIKGQVYMPGVYQMQTGDMVIDLIDRAGGLLENAYEDNISFVQALENHQVIDIPSKEISLDKKAVEVKGQVNQPGVYYFYGELRIIELINMAGGFTEDANYQHINLSEIVNDELVVNIPAIEDDEIMLAVDLKGQVKYPGVYYVSEGKRLIDVIKLAGGFRPEADTSLVNLSQFIVDEMAYTIPKINNQKEYIYVEISGEVLLPGIYALEPGDRLIMLINRAGGFTVDAYTDGLNLTRRLEDEEVIEIVNVEDTIFISIGGQIYEPGVYRVQKGISIIELIDLAGGLTMEADLEGIDFYEIINESKQVIIPSIGDQPVEIPIEPNGLVNINEASSEELQTLLGVGVILAERIITYRETISAFTTPEDIMNVSGIKEAIYESIKDDITV
jgi:competence protein ComEA